ARRLREKKHELVPAVAGGDVHAAHIRGDHLARDHQQLIAHLVPEAVVELLVTVQVDHHAGQILLVASGLGEKLFDHAAEVPAVVYAGQRIGRGHLLELRVLLFQLFSQLFALANDLGDGQVLLNHQGNGKEVIADLHDVVGGPLADGFGGG